MKFPIFYFFIFFVTQTFGISEGRLMEPNEEFDFSYEIEFGEIQNIGNGKCVGLYDGELIVTMDEKFNIQLINNTLNVKQEKLFLESNIFKELGQHKGHLSYFKIKVFESKIGLFYSYKLKSSNVNTLNFSVYNCQDNSFGKPFF